MEPPSFGVPAPHAPLSILDYSGNLAMYISVQFADSFFATQFADSFFATQKIYETED